MPYLATEQINKNVCTISIRNTSVAVKNLRGISALAAGDCPSLAVKTDERFGP